MKAVIFDKDGVLMDSEKTNVESATKALETLGIEYSNEDVAYINARNATDMAVYFYQKYGVLEQNFLEEKRKNYKELIKDTKIFEWTINFIRQLKTDWYPLWLVTSWPKEPTMEALVKLGLTSVFDVIITGDICDNRKPHPEPYLRWAEWLWIDPRDILVVEDSVYWLTSAKSAWMKVVLFNSSKVDVTGLKHDYLVENDNEFSLDLLK